MIMIKCSKHSEKKWNGLNPAIPKAEGHFEKDAWAWPIWNFQFATHAFSAIVSAKTATSQLGRMQ